MTITTVSSREFQQNASLAQKAAGEGPVFITNRGKPAHVLLNYDEYVRLLGSKRNLLDALAMPGAEDIELEIPPLGALFRPTDLT